MTRQITTSIISMIFTSTVDHEYAWGLDPATAKSNQALRQMAIRHLSIKRAEFLTLGVNAQEPAGALEPTSRYHHDGFVQVTITRVSCEQVPSPCSSRIINTIANNQGEIRSKAFRGAQHGVRESWDMITIIARKTKPFAN